MKLLSLHQVAFAACIFLLSFITKAQHSQVFLGTGLSSLQGETSDEFFFADEIGVNVSSKYLYSLKNERFVAYGEASHTSIDLYRHFSSSQGFSKFFYNRFNQTYLGAGMRFYLSKSITKLNPYQGQILPYVGASIGALYTSRNVVINDNTPSGQFKAPPVDPMQGYTITDGNTVEVGAQLEAGIAYVLNRKYTLEIFGSGRPGFSDTWDGITGVTNGNDWLMSGGMGLTIRLL